MIVLYIWVAVVSILILMGITELIIKTVDLGRGVVRNWSGYHSMLITLCFIAFFPIMVLAACMKQNK